TSPQSAGSASTTTVTVAIEDALGSRATSNSSAIAASLGTSCTGAGGGNVVTASSGATTQGAAQFLFTSNGAYTGCVVTFTSSGLSGTSATIVFNPGAADHLGCTFSPTSIAASGGTTAVGLVNVEDQLNNNVNAGTFSVNFSGSGSGATSLQTTNPQTMSSGVATYIVKATGTVGTDTYTPSISSGGTLPTVVANQTCQISTY
ncbi:MAG: hypothetical protein KGQ88_00460, partial [Chloroflexi bacterium]|nr:hypothetical protein [Chloroflexota bacterium]